MPPCQFFFFFFFKVWIWNAPSRSAWPTSPEQTPARLSASLSVLHLGRQGLEALENWTDYMDGVWITWREVTDGTDRVSSPIKPASSHRGPGRRTRRHIKGRRRRRPGQGLSYRSPDIWLSSMLRHQPATPVWQLYALHYCALMRFWITFKF